MTVTVTNADGASASDTVHIRIKAPPQPGHPIVHIATPRTGPRIARTPSTGAASTSSSRRPRPRPIRASRRDATYAWTDSINGGARQTIATTLTPIVKLYLAAGQRDTIHDLG